MEFHCHFLWILIQYSHQEDITNAIYYKSWWANQQIRKIKSLIFRLSIRVMPLCIMYEFLKTIQINEQIFRFFKIFKSQCHVNLAFLKRKMKSKPKTIQFSHLNQKLKISLRDWSLKFKRTINVLFQRNYWPLKIKLWFKIYNCIRLNLNTLYLYFEPFYSV